MKEYKVRILDTVFDDIADIADYIVSVSTLEHAAKYARELGAEIMTLRYLADFIPESRYRSVRHYHPHAKQLRTRNKQLNIIFHIEGDYVIVDKILASKMIIN
jgi:plasmid stabilization system protein ParE